MKRDILKATVTVFVLTLIAKAIAFGKSVLQASYFGATIETDAFNLSSGFVNNILYMITTALAVSFVPIYVQRKKKGEEEGKRFATISVTVLFFAAIITSVIMMLLAPLIIKVIAPLYEGEIFNMTVNYFRVLCTGISFSLITQLFTNLLNAEKKYGFSSLTSIINSLTLIIMIVAFANTLGVWTLVISVPVSFIVQWFALSWKSRKYAKISLCYGIKDKALIQLLLQATPILISQATVEINQVIDRALLTTIGTGIVTSVSYSAVLYLFASALISTPLSTVMFTELSEAAAEKNVEKMSGILSSCYRVLFLLCIPIVIVIIFCSHNIVTIVYGHGRFTEIAIAQCAIGLATYGFCLLPVGIKTVLSRAYYSLNDTKRPMIIGIFEVILNIGLSIALVRPFGIAGVVGATAIASVVFIIIMLIDFNKKYYKVLNRKEIISYWKKILSGVIILVIFLFVKDITVVNALVSFAIKTVIAFASYFMILLLLKDTTMINVSKKAFGYLNKYRKK